MNETEAPALAAPPEWLTRHRASVRGLSLDSVIGLSSAKAELRSLAARLQHPEIVLAAGAALPRGILFFGPPGTGKSLLARTFCALLGDEVEFYALAASDMDPPRFEELSAYLATRPETAPLVALFFDEVDFLATHADGYRTTDRTRAALAAALAAIDGFDDRTAGRVLWLGATNSHPASLSPAFTRAGRYGHWVEVLAPTRSERQALFEFFASTRRTEPDIDWAKAAALAGRGATPAVIKQSLDDALAMALAEEGAAAVVRWHHVAASVQRGGIVSDSRPMTPSERLAVAQHESAHACAALVLGRRPTSLRLERDGGRTESEFDDRAAWRNMSDQYLVDSMVVSFAGSAADRLIRGAMVGGEKDIASATSLALTRIAHGTDPAARPINYDRFVENAPLAEEERMMLVAAACQAARTRAEALVAEHLAAIKQLALILAERGHLSGDELQAALIVAAGPELFEAALPQELALSSGTEA